MLVELYLKNLGVVETAQVLLNPGMTVVTGETGAGKTVVVEAVASLCGAKVDSSLVRRGSDEATVVGRFVELSVRDTVNAEVVVRRVVPANGRTRTYLDDEPVSLSQLGDMLSDAVSLHGQHAHQQLLSAASQRSALDEYGRVELEELNRLRAERKQIDALTAELTADPVALQRERDIVSYQLAELLAANLTDPNEDELLKERDLQLSNRESFVEAGALVVDLLDGDDAGAVTKLSEAAAALAKLAGYESRVAELVEMSAQAQELARELRQQADTSETAETELDALRQRRLVLRDLRRKYGATLAEVIEFRDRAATRANDLESIEERLAELAVQRAKVDVLIAKESAIVKTQRLDAALGLAKTVSDHLRQLAMPTASFSVDIDGDDGSAVTFLLAPNAGQDAQPLAKAASGGELSRTMLALHQALLIRDEIAGDQCDSYARKTLIFDEVDAGVGGEAGEAIGIALAQLALRYQLIVITHLPQVAAFADSHVVVSKSTEGATTTASVDVLTEEQRVAELARMLAGKKESASARDHALELLGDAQSIKKQPLASAAVAGKAKVAKASKSKPAGKAKSA
jgi:DNA repair protein RecN (Recombination protein N)